MKPKISFTKFVTISVLVAFAAFAAIAVSMMGRQPHAVAQTAGPSAPELPVTISPDPIYAWNGYTATFTATVQNNTGVQLDTLHFSFPGFPECDGSVSNVPNGDSHEFVCAASPVTNPDVYHVTSNAFTAYITGTQGVTEYASPTDVNIQVFNASILLKIRQNPYIMAGPEGVPINLTITNTGDITLTFVRIQYNHPAVGPLPAGASTDCGYYDHITVTNLLAPNASIEYTCYLTATSQVTQPIVFNEWARGAPPVPGQFIYTGDTDYRLVLIRRSWLPIVMK